MIVIVTVISLALAVMIGVLIYFVAEYFFKTEEKQMAANHANVYRQISKDFRIVQLRKYSIVEFTLQMQKNKYGWKYIVSEQPLKFSLDPRKALRDDVEKLDAMAKNITEKLEKETNNWQAI